MALHRDEKVKTRGQTLVQPGNPRRSQGSLGTVAIASRRGERKVLQNGRPEVVRTRQSRLVRTTPSRYDPPPMGNTPPLRALPAPGPDFWNHRAWFLGILVLAFWQGWITLSLFGTVQPWVHLFDDQPILSGRHPLHFYHSCLGSRAFFDHGSLCCFDPAFEAGYPKTPVFDSGSRPGELFLLLAGGKERPAAYKIGLAASCLAVPFLLALAALTAGLSRAGAFLATLAGLLVWWGKPGRDALEAGDLDLLIASLAALGQAGLLLRYHQSSGFLAWLGILVLGYLGWFAHPIFFAVLLPLGLVYYLSVGTRHPMFWHFALLVSLAGALAINAFWLIDWLQYWWIQAPLHAEPFVLSHRTLHTIWDAPIWGTPGDRSLALLLMAAAVLGVWLLNWERQRPTARLFGLASVGLFLLAVAGVCWRPLGEIGSPRLLTSALLFAVFPAVHAVQAMARRLGGVLRSQAASAVAAALVLAAAAFLVNPDTKAFVQFARGSDPFTLTLNPGRQEIVHRLREQTTSEARILWEDRTGPRTASHWATLLPRWTDRALIGGLDPEAGIEHSYPGLTDGVLAGQPIDVWTDQELEKYCHHYNIGWIACWSSPAIGRLHSWNSARELASLRDDGLGVLFEVVREQRTYALKGQARLLQADSQRITLGDVIPDNGEVLLSLHYQKGMIASPGRVQVKPKLDPLDPIPFVLLKVSGPVARVTISWDHR